MTALATPGEYLRTGDARLLRDSQAASARAPIAAATAHQATYPHPTQDAELVELFRLVDQRLALADQELRRAASGGRTGAAAPAQSARDE